MIPTLNHPLGMPYARRLQYLASTGTQYIDTGIAPDYANGDSIEIHLYGAGFSGAAPCAFGSRESGVLNGIYLLGTNNLIVCDTAGNTGIGFLASAPTELSLTVNDSTATANGTSYTMPRHVTVGLPIYLFALNNYGTGTFGIYSGMKLYDWKYYRNGKLAQHLIPVLDKSGVPCLYDTVSRTMKRNAGTGSFDYA